MKHCHDGGDRLGEQGKCCSPPFSPPPSGWSGPIPQAGEGWGVAYGLAGGEEEEEA